ncbi:AIPR protein [Caballeronia pedi]|uniref:AIPR protein n=1 Tax=Caballeronia pedi TaxID=1777141 RepID=A0A158A3I4_9BURK|nr:AIPR family protein [Caballeronia pedi]SAK51657.1 AIPR protein [Caballeronia pedi]
MRDIKEFLEELKQIVVRRAKATSSVDTIAFVSEVAERLEEDPVFGEFVSVEYLGTGSRNRQLKVHGFTELDEADGSIGLVVGKWLDDDEPATLTTAEVNRLSSWLENFVREAIELRLNERIAEANTAYELASQLIGYQSKISRIRLHIFSNQTLSTSFKDEKLGEVAGIPLERHIWDLRRLKAMYESSREREAVEVDLTTFGSEGIPCIEAARTEELRSFLCVLDGTLLANLFERYGSRLLEGNVRSFLGMKGGVNKGIRGTIQDSPSLFFAYNNGIAATATDVTIQQVNGRPVLTRLVDFQIVNGGQTTASILSARKKDQLSLSGVTVQMKLTEVNREGAHDLIPRIAQFANTQNKVAVADFFANHPFHRKMEEISRRLQIPAKVGARIQSKWFYERSRGQFQNERLYLTKAKKDAFDLEYPPEQLINKTELAKYDSTWGEKPHWVSLGAQKNFTRFADQFSSKTANASESEHWNAISPSYGDAYYKRMVAIAILWKQAELVVSSGRGDWYKGDYRPQIVAYSLSLLFYSLRQKRNEFDLGSVWTKQSADSTIENCIRELAIVVQDILLDPPSGITNVGEWSKKEACWEKVKQSAAWDVESIGRWSIDKDDFMQEKATARAQGAQDDGIAVQKAVFELTITGYWKALLGWPKCVQLLDLPDRQLLTKASTVQGFTRINIERNWRKLLEIKRLCTDEGFRSV